MSDFSYSVNPYEIRHLLSAPGIKPIDRFIYRELMDLCWMTEKQDRMDYSPSDLATYLELSEEEVEASINRLARPEFGILSTFLDLDSEDAGECIVIKYLSDQIERIETDRRSKATRDFVEEVAESETSSVIDRISRRDSDVEPSIIYLERSERAYCPNYSGWLPTRNFANSGEAYNIRKDFVSSLEARFPRTDSTAILTAIYDYLVKYPDRRPTLSRMSKFVFNWFENNRAGNTSASASPKTVDADVLSVLSNV